MKISKAIRSRRSFNWYGLYQRFSIRKYHFGAASVLLGTALMFGVQADQVYADGAVSPASEPPASIAAITQQADTQVSPTLDNTVAATSAETANSTEAAAPQTEVARATGTPVTNQNEATPVSPATSTVDLTPTAASQISTPSDVQTSESSTSAVSASGANSELGGNERSAASQINNQTVSAMPLVSSNIISERQSQSPEMPSAFAAALEDMKRQGLATDTQVSDLRSAYRAGLLNDKEVNQVSGKLGSTPVTSASPVTVFMAEGTGETPPIYAPHLHTKDIALQVTNSNTANKLIRAVYLHNYNRNPDGSYTIEYQIYLRGNMITDPYAAVMVSTDDNTTVGSYYSWTDTGSTGLHYPSGTDAYTSTDGDRKYTNSPVLVSDVISSTTNPNASITNPTGVGFRVLVNTTSLTGTGLTINVAQGKTEQAARDMAAGGVADDAAAKDSVNLWLQDYSMDQGPTIQPAIYFLPIGLTLTKDSNVRAIVDGNPKATGSVTIDQIYSRAVAFGGNNIVNQVNGTLQSQLGGSADVTFDPATGIITGTVGGLLAGGREGAMVNGVTVVATDSTGTAMSDDNNAVNFAHVVVKGLSGVKNEGETFTEDELKKLIRFRTWMGTSYGEEPLDYLMKNGNVFSNRNFYKAENSTLVAIKPFHDFVQKMEILTPIASTGTNNTATIRVTYGNTMTGDVLGSMDYTVNYGYSVAPSVTPINPVVAVNPGVTYSPAANVTIADQDNSGYRSQTVEVTDASGSVVYAGELGDFTAPTTEGTYTVKVSVTDNSATQYNGKTEDIGYDEATPKTVKLLDKDIHDLSASGTYQLIVAKQKANIKFVNDTEPTVAMTTVSESGNNGYAIPTVDYKTTLNDYLKAGYSVKSDNFTGGKTFDTDFDTDQEFTVVLKERIEPFDPANPPVPGQPVDPNDPNSPRWPDNVKDQKGTETVTRIIRYVYAADGSQASAPVSETLTFTRQAKVNLVTGEVAFGEWTATDTTFDVVVSPVINSYITDRKEVPAKTGVQATDADSEEIVKYTKLGHYVPNIPVLNFPDNPYPNDPTDPTKPKQPVDPDYPVIPHNPGYTPIDPNTNTPLTPVDPNEPSKGYIPPIPEDPTEDTPINYEADTQKAIINFVTETGRQLSQLTEAGKSEEAIPSANYTAALAGYLKTGYALVSDDFGGHQVFDKNQLVDQTFTVVLKERIEPFDPANPPVPDQPVNPNDPNSPKWPSTVENQQGTEAVTRTIRYVYAADGSQASAPVSETLTFTRQAKVNLVTGEVAFGEWMATDTTFDAVVSPVINSYITDRK
ncbi:MucBP domain protein [Streptococcus criceti]|uniref:mucin-binding protein n=1 Tax=Streptococcus criceti TaxID=1333 RepID=UPI000225CE16|nr:YSIRK-type signal peptide-containing protein [Streptococcus criceti]SUN43244.1 MucBP domain protein [Streptococcus criceti]